jgi:hypothetical protein
MGELWDVQRKLETGPRGERLIGSAGRSLAAVGHRHWVVGIG